ncbi:MAG: HD domain-containing protein [Vampirovibrionales bacterium]|nr:HD domain-containing protein [Vampirovibrionales bacterium]
MPRVWIRVVVPPFANIARLVTDRPLSAAPSGPSLMDMVVLLASGADLAEGRAVGHAQRVALLSLALGDALQLSPRRKSTLLFAALLHDAGLIPLIGALAPRLPTGVSEKRWFAVQPRMALDPAAPAYEAFRTPAMPDACQSLFESHPKRATSLVEALLLSADVHEAIAATHERLDGSGFPHGLSGGQIPPESRIIALADALDASLGDINSAATRSQILEAFFDPEHATATTLFDPDVLAAARRLWAPQTGDQRGDTSLQAIYGPAPDKAFRQSVTAAQYPERFAPLSGRSLASIARALGALSDSLLPVYADDHSERAAELALAMARHLEIDDASCGALYIAGLLQNIGMWGVPGAILAKPQPLSEEQRLAMQDHARFTGDLLARAGGFGEIALWAGEHHERMNGSGYYQGKKGRDISVGGRILALADAYVAMTSPRPYREAFEPAEALALIQQGRVRLYDATLSGVLRQVVTSGRS